MSDQLNLEQHSKLPQIFREKNLAENCFRNKHVRSLYLMKKTSNNKEHVSSEKRSALIAFKLHEIEIFSTCMFWKNNFNLEKHFEIYVVFW